jgi:hypothetical protein
MSLELLERLLGLPEGWHIRAVESDWEDSFMYRRCMMIIEAPVLPRVLESERLPERNMECQIEPGQKPIWEFSG